MSVRAIAAVRRILFPVLCPFCREPIDLGRDTCADCDLQNLRVCSKINRRGIEPTEGRTLQYVDRAVAPFLYRGLARDAVEGFKFAGRLGSARTMALYMARTAAEFLPMDEIDAVLTVPMRPKAQKRQGYAHAELLARFVASRLDKPLLRGCLQKIYDTQKQHNLGKIARSANLLGAFEVTDPEGIKGKTVLLCDDILTTGATAVECAKMLRLRGCKTVYLLTFAAVIKNREERDEDGK